MLARPWVSIETWKKSSNERSPRPATPHTVPLLQMSPTWMAPEMLRSFWSNDGVGPPCESAVVALCNCANATVHFVPISPGSRWYIASDPGAPPEPGGPPVPWYQTTSRRPAPAAAIHGKMSEADVAAVTVWLLLLIWNGFDQVDP